jgi:hypothetical protein
VVVRRLLAFCVGVLCALDGLKGKRSTLHGSRSLAGGRRDVDSQGLDRLADMRKK